MKAINQFRSDIYSGTNEAWLKKSVDGEFIRPDSALYKSIPADSIDFSVIEKCPNSQNFNIQMIPLAAGWNDLGSWEAFFQSNKVDEFGNVSFGDSLIKETKNSLIYSTKRLVSTLGVENLIIVETDDALLVADKSKSQDVKILVEELKIVVVRNIIFIEKFIDLGVGMTISIMVKALKLKGFRLNPGPV